MLHPGTFRHQLYKALKSTGNVEFYRISKKSGKKSSWTTVDEDQSDDEIIEVPRSRATAQIIGPPTGTFGSIPATTRGWSYVHSSGLSVVERQGETFTADGAEKVDAPGPRKLYSVDELHRAFGSDRIKRTLDVLGDMADKKELDFSMETAVDYRHCIMKDKKRLQAMCAGLDSRMFTSFSKVSKLVLTSALERSVDNWVTPFMASFGLDESAPFQPPGGDERYLLLSSQPFLCVAFKVGDHAVMLKSVPELIVTAAYVPEAGIPDYIGHWWTENKTIPGYDVRSAHHIGEGFVIGLYNYAHLLVDTIITSRPLPERIVAHVARPVGSYVTYGRLEMPIAYFDALLQNQRPPVDSLATFVYDQQPAMVDGKLVCGGDDFMSAKGRLNLARKVLSSLAPMLTSVIPSAMPIKNMTAERPLLDAGQICASVDFNDQLCCEWLEQFHGIRMTNAKTKWRTL
eukprot:TRINITY_DN3572_c0_g1_i1.p2 TRINITY_DN3572_c0_g1~~TRINITY_DN3572_c0_g1_i1.p2  ORF type:complete len:458 (+),score=77.17 TRINITY_DN3572_c0_g1_i1:160-1533(+)